MKHKNLKVEIKSVDDAGSFTGYASVFNNVDLGGDIIAPGAFTKTIKENPQVPILWGHDSQEVIGINKEWKEDTVGLYVTGQLILDVQRAKEARSLIQVGAVKGMSIGYDPITVDYSQADKGIRILKEVKLWEYSLTPFPMNPEAQITGVKSMDDFEGELAELLVYAGKQKGAEREVLIAQAIKQFSALQAAQAPGAAKQDDNAPDLLHAGLKCDELFKILQGAL
jgi:HK97 family phage prohead protease